MPEAVASGRLRDRVALVTGAAGGIGGATARCLAAEGARVALLARSRDAVAAAAAELATEGVAIGGDLRDPTVAEAAVETAIGQLGRLDIVVNAAGLYAPAALAETTRHLWEDSLAVNLSASFFIGRKAGLWMKEHGGGQIVNVSSEVAMRGVAGNAAYAAAKAGLIGLTRAMAVELAPGVTVNTVSPGAVDTPMMYTGVEGDPERFAEDLAKQIPLRRVADPDEVAKAILFLVTDGTYATGSNLALDGGTTAASYWVDR